MDTINWNVFQTKRFGMGLVGVVLGGLFIINGLQFYDLNYWILLLICAFFGFIAAKWVTSPPEESVD